MKKSTKIQIAILAYMYFCVYLVTFSGINVKEVQLESWFVEINYMIGVILCTPATFLLSLVPESLEVSSVILSALTAAISVALIAVIVFYAQILSLFENKSEKNAQNV